MKKNAMLKIAAILMVAVLLTTCAISSTFAKYVTTGDTATEVGRVAKWGVGITSTVSGIFAEQYENGNAVTTENPSDGADVLALSSASVKELVAPGTQKAGTITAAISGTPEVAFEITTVATVTLTGWEIDDDDNSETDAVFYCPLVFNVGGTEIDGTEYTSATAMADAIKTAIQNKGTAQYPAGASTVANNVVAVSWAWAMETVTEDATAAENNVKDTILGDAGAATVSITVTQTATQIQDYIAP